jgi:hypothetical protein
MKLHKDEAEKNQWRGRHLAVALNHVVKSISHSMFPPSELSPRIWRCLDEGGIIFRSRGSDLSVIISSRHSPSKDIEAGPAVHVSRKKENRAETLEFPII